MGPTSITPPDEGMPVIVVLTGLPTHDADRHRAQWLRHTITSLSLIYTDPPVVPVEVLFETVPVGGVVATSCYLTASQAFDLDSAAALGRFLLSFAESSKDRRAGVFVGDTYYGIFGRTQ